MGRTVVRQLRPMHRRTIGLRSRPKVHYQGQTRPNTGSGGSYRPYPFFPPYKVKPSPAFARGWEGLSQYNPMAWWGDCCLPTPAKGQFWVGPRVTFARIQGKARRGQDLAAFQTSMVDFDDHLNIKKNGNAIWSIEVMYQFRPRWGIRYSFSPILLEGNGTPRTAFSFGSQTFAAGTEFFSKWERYQHRAGLVFNITRSMNSQANLFADWLNIQDRLTIGAAGTIGASATWDDTKNLAEVGLEFDKCLKNYHGNTLALSGKAGVAFLNDSLGYEAEAALSYLIPIKTGRFGFVKGGYSYAKFEEGQTPRGFRHSHGWSVHPTRIPILILIKVYR